MTGSAAMPRVLPFLAGAGALAAANLHYSQPLLPSIAASLGVPNDAVAALPAATQIGFAIGIVAILPLADMLERRGLVAAMLVSVAAALLVHAAAPTLTLLYLGAFLVGLAGVTPQLLTPFAALLAPKGREGRAVGLVLSGVLIGVLVSKVIAGFVTATVGWRGLYAGAAVAMLALAAAMRLVLPASRPAQPPRYAELLRSAARLAREEPRLRRHALYGGLTFASFMAFWSSYAIHLARDFSLGPAAAGLFGVVGLAGSAAASVAGRQIDRGRFAPICIAAALLVVAGFGLLLAVPRSIPVLVLGCLLLDAGAGLSHAANQTTAFALRPEARGRINSVYMAGYFLGGAVGTAAAAWLMSTWGWGAVCAFGATTGALILLVEVITPTLRVPRPLGIVVPAPTPSPAD